MSIWSEVRGQRSEVRKLGAFYRLLLTAYRLPDSRAGSVRRGRFKGVTMRGLLGLVMVLCPAGIMVSVAGFNPATYRSEGTAAYAESRKGVIEIP